MTGCSKTLHTALVSQKVLCRNLEDLDLRLSLLPIWPEWNDVAVFMPQTLKDSYPNTFIVMDAIKLRCEATAH